MLEKIMSKNRALILAYDHGLEHGPTDFNDKNVDPKFILDIALKGKYTAVALQKGIVLKYYKEKYTEIPLLLKLNGKTNLLKEEPFSPLICDVDEAIRLRASAVGYTIYLGSENEAKMFEIFSKIEEDAHAQGLGVVAWMYPRGKAVKDELDPKILSYAARVGLELGADMIKIKYNGNPKDLEWIVKSAGKTKVVISGGMKIEEKKFLEEVKDVMRAGASGIAVGRNVWQGKDPMEITKKLKKIIFA